MTLASPISPVPAEDRLRDIRSITDAALSHLDEQDLLAELLDRVKEVLRADTAAVLLYDHAAGHLTATAAVGLEEARQGTRVPFGAGFAGRIAAEQRPVVIDHVDHTTVVNPVLLQHGIQCMLGVPMVVAGRVIGVLHVGSLRPRVFTPADVELLELAADRAAIAVHSMSGAADRIAARALHRSLLPGKPPLVPGVEAAARYIPGNGVAGGDWYDVFVLPSGELGLVIGDVAGTGLPAALIMGRMRSTLRAYALETRDPGVVLDRLDRKMQHFEPGALATVLYAIVDPALDRMHVALAGHFPPILARPGQPAEPADIGPELMIGVDASARRQGTAIKIPPGTLICLYTDGLIERPGVPIDDSMAKLCRAVSAKQPDTACAEVMLDMVGADGARDDVALLMVRMLASEAPGQVAG